MSATTQPDSLARIIWDRAVDRVRRTPRRTLVLILVGAFLVLAVAIYTHVAQGHATLQVKVQHSFRSAELSVWVDDQLACTAHMSGYAVKRLGLLPSGVRGNFTKAVSVSTGRHQIRVSVESGGGAYVQTGRTDGDFPAEQEKILIVNAGREGDLYLSWDDAGLPMTQAGPGWLTRYANQMLMAVSGSIVSALTAYLIKEIPLFKPSAPRVESPEKS